MTETDLTKQREAARRALLGLPPEEPKITPQPKPQSAVSETAPTIQKTQDKSANRGETTVPISSEDLGETKKEARELSALEKRLREGGLNPHLTSQIQKPDETFYRKPEPEERQLTFDKYREQPTLEPEEDTQKTPQPEETIEIEESPTPLPRIQTFENDVYQTLEKQRASLANIAAAEFNKRSKKEHPPVPKPSSKPSGINVKMILLIILIFSTIGLLGFVALNRPASPQQPDRGTGGTQSSISFLREESISREIVTQQLQQPYIILVPASGDDLHPMRPGEFFEIMGIEPPRRITQVLGDEVLIGREETPFLVFETTRFEHTFAGMLEWESTLVLDIGNMFGVSSNGDTFKDLVLQNQDFRVLEETGIPILAYMIDSQNRVFIGVDPQHLLSVRGRYEELSRELANRER